MQRSGVDPNEVQELVFGNVIPSVKAPNIAREIVLGTGLPRKIPAYSVSKACASANQAITAAWLQSRGFPFDEAELDAAIGRADRGDPRP